MDQITKDFSLHLNILKGTKVLAWALGEDIGGTDVQVIADGRIDDAGHMRSRVAVLVEVLDFIGARSDHESLSSVGLFVYDPESRKILQDLGGRFGKIFIMAKSEMSRPQGWETPGYRKCVENLGSGEFAVEPAPGRVIDLATDGSVCGGRGGGASYGWIRDDGRYGIGTVDNGDILLAELVAVSAALSAAVKTERLRIHIDSKPALTCLNRTVAQGRHRHSNQIEAVIRTIHTLIGKQAEVELVWVKAHVRHALNDGADRLARLARQTRVGVSSAVRVGIARNIVDDALAAHSAGVAA